MPKARRKRVTTRNNPITQKKKPKAKAKSTPKKRQTKTTTNDLVAQTSPPVRSRSSRKPARLAVPAESNLQTLNNSNQEQIKASYYNLSEHPNDSIKSKSTGKFLKVPKPPANFRIPKDWDVRTGDLLSWGDYRAADTFFVMANGTLLENPDTSGSGYLTIPIQLTSRFSDALDYFSDVLDGIGRSYATSIELAPTDAFFAKNFSKQPLPASIQKRTDISFSLDPSNETLYVKFASNPSESQDFPLDTTKIDDIIQFITSENEAKDEIIVTFDFEGQETCSKVPHGNISGLPSGWKSQQHGSLMFGDSKIQGGWKCKGPKVTKEMARKAIENHYKGLTVEIK